MKTKRFLLKPAIFSFMAIGIISNAQVGINTVTPDPSSLLDVTSTTQGVLLPRMTTAERLAIASPATGLVVYDTQLSAFFGYNGTAWTQDVFSGTRWGTSGNSGITANNFLGTTNNAILSFRANNNQAMTISGTGAVTINSTNNLGGPRLTVIRANPSTSRPSLLTTINNGAGTAYPINIITGNASAGTGRVFGNYSFAANTAAANIGTSIGGISYTSTNAAFAGGILFYAGGQPANNDDTSREVMYLGSNQNVYIGYATFSTGSLTLPTSKVNVRGGDVYIDTIGSGVVMTSPNGSCYRVIVDNTGTLQTNAITCP